jgi:RimJ/RimL family protein N-acetyltransferase
MTGRIKLREVQESDLPAFFEHQHDPVANQMATFPAREREAFMVHWRKILADDAVTKRTVVFEGEVAGNIVCYEQSGKLLLGYWLGRRFWGLGVATCAVSEFVSLIFSRPLHANVAKRNLASIRVLQKCGFEISGESCGPATANGEAVDELIYTLSK